MVLIAALVIVLGTQFDYGGKAPKAKAPKLTLQLRQVTPIKNNRVTLAVRFENEGGGVVKLDRAQVTEALTHVIFIDQVGRRISYDGEDTRPYEPLDPKHPISLYSGYFYGYEREFRFGRAARDIYAIASSAYMPSAEGVWYGQLTSKKIRVLRKRVLVAEALTAHSRIRV